MGAAIFSPFHAFTFSLLNALSPLNGGQVDRRSHLFIFSLFHPFTFKRLFTFNSPFQVTNINIRNQNSRNEEMDY